MKQILISSVLALVLVSCGKKTTPPDPVVNGFEKQFPGVKPKWEKEGNMYEANFKSNAKEASAVFAENGQMIESEVEIVIAELPEQVKTYLDQHYKGEQIKETAKITNSAGKVEYEVAIKGKDLMFDSSGNFLKEVAD